MALLIQKFGGSSLDGPERLSAAALRIAAAYSHGQDVVAVLSARGKTTDRLLAEAQAISDPPPARETDLLLSVGEQISVCHMAMQLQAMGYPAVALTGWQAGIGTDGQFGDARVLRIGGERIRQELSAGKIVLVTGFQGLSPDGDVTTLGRGGSDTTAVALAAYLGAAACRIYTDVDGVYTGDPRELPEARKLDAVSYDDMLEMARQGAKVLHSRCVEIAKERGLTFEVCSALENRPGTLVGPLAARRFCGVAIRRGVLLPIAEGTVAAVSLVGKGCADRETAVEALRALTPLRLLQLARQPHCLTAYVPEEAAREAAETLHRRFLT